jgi:hypothetical protein
MYKSNITPQHYGKSAAENGCTGRRFKLPFLPVSLSSQHHVHFIILLITERSSVFNEHLGLFGDQLTLYLVHLEQKISYDVYT